MFGNDRGGVIARYQHHAVQQVFQSKASRTSPMEEPVRATHRADPHHIVQVGFPGQTAVMILLIRGLIAWGFFA